MGLQGKDPSEIPAVLSKEGPALIKEHLLHILDYASKNKDKADRSWPVLLKSNQFFLYVTAYLAGIRRVPIPGGPASGSSSPPGKRPKRQKRPIRREDVRKKLKKQGLPDATINAMIKAID